MKKKKTLKDLKKHKFDKSDYMIETNYSGAMADLEALIARCRKAISQNDLEGLKTFLRLNYPKKD